MTLSVHDLPASLTSALIRLGPLISTARVFLECASWKHARWSASFVLVAAWWALCLLVTRAWMLGLLALGGAWWQARQERRGLGRIGRPRTVGTEAGIQRTVDDLHILDRLLPGWPSTLPELNTRAAIFIGTTWLSICVLVPGRILIGIAGSVVLCVRAPWFVYLAHTLWRSAYIRWAAYTAWARISGTPLQRSIVPQSVSPPTPTEDDLFLFTVYQNERWWVGLDWTAALLPNERPSWSSAPPACHAVAPPALFALPPGWEWVEKEWSVLVKTTDEHDAERVERPLPATEDSDKEKSGLLAKAAGRFTLDSKHEKPVEATEEKSNDDDEPDPEPLTDADGWVQCDNKWQAGKGKYTRFRRWTRIAVVRPAPAVQTTSVIASLPNHETSYFTRQASETSRSPTRQVKPDSPKEAQVYAQSTAHSPSQLKGSKLSERLKSALGSPSAR
ncbi:hypothetical protein CYLTODRAFT_484583 [Cylindrobasidium torrendii FP15055 ss-10]|uniref:Peroxin/Ferlin domain-containing protein n=1 Tax=Cylindrobasidium torrendii FP15055 ss-10 TaxID=1314674 RepID=A0A0D7BX94_9AGAR|nr:hypothetical protein CYLTODRAFT_484583 [Cylindrobasidium torrendii FP15055 ss-10]